VNAQPIEGTMPALGRSTKPRKAASLTQSVVANNVVKAQRRTQFHRLVATRHQVAEKQV